MRQDQEFAWRPARRVAAAFLRGGVSAIETAGELEGVRHEVDAEGELYAALTALAAVESETDDIPTGERRKLWHPDVREREDRRLAEAEAWAEPIVREACETILRLTAES